MGRSRLYLDTSLISHLDAKDTPEKMNDTLFFWQDIINGKFAVYISNVTLEEISECPEPKQTVLLEYLGQIDYEIQRESEESLELTGKYLDYGVLKEKSRDDLRHIALAVVAECDYIVSWNFKHFVNIKTITKVQAVNKLLGYSEITILPPLMLSEGDEADD